MKPTSSNGSSTGTPPKKVCRRPRWLGPLLEDPTFRRMRKALIREIAPETVLEWIEAEEFVMSQYQSMRFRNWHTVILEQSHWDGTKSAVKRRLRQRCPSDREDELEWKTGQLWHTIAPSIERVENRGGDLLGSTIRFGRHRSKDRHRAPAPKRSPTAYRAKAEPKNKRGSSKSENRSDEIDASERRRTFGRTYFLRRATDNHRS